MVKTLNLYLLKQFWATLILIIFTFIFLVFFADTLDNLDNFIECKLPLYQYFRYYFLTAPMVFIVCLPIAVLLSGMRLFRNLSLQNEYIALIMGGISLRKMLLPIIFSAFVLSTLSYYISGNVMPKTNLKRKIMQKEKFRIELQILRNKNLLGKEGRTYYISEYHKNKKIIKGFMLTETDTRNRIQKRIYAEELVWKDHKWHGSKIKIQSFYPNGLPATPDFADSYIFDDLFTPSDILLSKDEPKYLTNTQLKKLIRGMDDSGKGQKGILMDYYRRLALSTLPFIILFMAIPFAIAPVRTASTKSIGFGIVLCIVYYVVDAIFYQAGKGDFIPPLLAAWLPNISISCISAFLIQKVPH